MNNRSISTALLIVLASALLSACKLEITVPAGGSVVTSSGLYACAAGETCTLTIDHPYFFESFTAVPARGYIFSRWKKIPGAFCAGSHKSVCEDIDTRIFVENTDLLDWLNFDASYSLTPVFNQLASPGEKQAAVWQLSSSHVAVNYVIDGATAEQIFDSLKGENNPLHISVSTGSKSIGLSEASFASGFTATGATSEGLCEVKAGTIEVTYTTTIPQLYDYQQKPIEIQDSWSRFQGDLVKHEAGHQQINRFYYGLLPGLYSAVGAVPCDELADAIKRVHKQWEEEIIAAQAQYHVDVGSSASFRDYF
jgi:predicted secreted Zn-dependent protease